MHARQIKRWKGYNVLSSIGLKDIETVESLIHHCADIAKKGMQFRYLSLQVLIPAFRMEKYTNSSKHRDDCTWSETDRLILIWVMNGQLEADDPSIQNELRFRFWFYEFIAIVDEGSTSQPWWHERLTWIERTLSATRQITGRLNLKYTYNHVWNFKNKRLRRQELQLITKSVYHAKGRQISCIYHPIHL